MYPIEYVAICEAMHFLLSASLGLSVYFLTLTTFYAKGVCGTRELLISLLLGLSSALLLHTMLDWWGAV